MQSSFSFLLVLGAPSADDGALLVALLPVVVHVLIVDDDAILHVVLLARLMLEVGLASPRFASLASPAVMRVSGGSIWFYN